MVLVTLSTPSIPTRQERRYSDGGRTSMLARRFSATIVMFRQWDFLALGFVFLLFADESSGAGCNDANNKCAPWASAGECYHNPGYMAVSCARSCQTATLCGGDTNDTIPKCWSKASTGFCEADVDNAMLTCRTTCTTRTETFCTTPPDVNHAHFNVRGVYRFMDRVLYDCDEGYEKTNSNHDGNHMCTDKGVWRPRTIRSQNKYPTCTIISCGDPPVLNNTDVFYTGTLYADVVTYTCQAGFYRVSGDTVRVCQGDKSWNGTDLTCEEILSPSWATSTLPIPDSSYDLYLEYTRSLSTMAAFEADVSGVSSTPDIIQDSSVSLGVRQDSPRPFVVTIESSSESVVAEEGTASLLNTVNEASTSTDIHESSAILATPVTIVDTSHLTGLVDGHLINSADISISKSDLPVDIHSSEMGYAGESTQRFTDLLTLVSYAFPLTETNSDSSHQSYLNSEQWSGLSGEAMLTVSLTSGMVVTDPSYAQQTPTSTNTIKPTPKVSAPSMCKCRCKSSSTQLATPLVPLSFEEILNMTKTVKTFSPKAVEAKGAVYVGASAIIIIGSIFSVIIFLDMVSLGRHLKILRHNLNCVSDDQILTENELWKS